MAKSERFISESVTVTTLFTFKNTSFFVDTNKNSKSCKIIF